MEGFPYLKEVDNVGSGGWFGLCSLRRRGDDQFWELRIVRPARFRDEERTPMTSELRCGRPRWILSTRDSHARNDFVCYQYFPDILSVSDSKSLISCLAPMTKGETEGVFQSVGDGRAGFCPREIDLMSLISCLAPITKGETEVVLPKSRYA